MPGNTEAKEQPLVQNFNSINSINPVLYRSHQFPTIPVSSHISAVTINPNEYASPAYNAFQMMALQPFSVMQQMMHFQFNNASNAYFNALNTQHTPNLPQAMLAPHSTSNTNSKALNTQHTPNLPQAMLATHTTSNTNSKALNTQHTPNLPQAMLATHSTSNTNSKALNTHQNPNLPQAMLATHSTSNTNSKALNTHQNPDLQNDSESEQADNVKHSKISNRTLAKKPLAPPLSLYIAKLPSFFTTKIGNDLFALLPKKRRYKQLNTYLYEHPFLTEKKSISIKVAKNRKKQWGLLLQPNSLDAVTILSDLVNPGIAALFTTKIDDYFFALIPENDSPKKLNSYLNDHPRLNMNESVLISVTQNQDNQWGLALKLNKKTDMLTILTDLIYAHLAFTAAIRKINVSWKKHLLTKLVDLFTLRLEEDNTLFARWPKNKTTEDTEEFIEFLADEYPNLFENMKNEEIELISSTAEGPKRPGMTLVSGDETLANDKILYQFQQLVDVEIDSDLYSQQVKRTPNKQTSKKRDLPFLFKTLNNDFFAFIPHKVDKLSLTYYLTNLRSRMGLKGASFILEVCSVCSIQSNDPNNDEEWGLLLRDRPRTTEDPCETIPELTALDKLLNRINEMSPEKPKLILTDPLPLVGYKIHTIIGARKKWLSQSNSNTNTQPQSNSNTNTQNSADTRKRKISDQEPNEQRSKRQRGNNTQSQTSSNTNNQNPVTQGSTPNSATLQPESPPQHPINLLSHSSRSGFKPISKAPVKHSSVDNSRSNNSKKDGLRFFTSADAPSNNNINQNPTSYNPI